MVVIGSKVEVSQKWWEDIVEKVRSEARDKLNAWMKHFSVEEQHFEFAEEMLSQTLSMLCR